MSRTFYWPKRVRAICKFSLYAPRDLDACCEIDRFSFAVEAVVGAEGMELRRRDPTDPVVRDAPDG